MKTLLRLAAAALVLAGCGSHAAGGATAHRTHAAHRRDAIARSGATRWARLVSLPTLGTFSTRCGRPAHAAHAVFAARYVASLATETVSLAVDGGKASRRTLQPGDAWVTTLRRIHGEVWRVAQSTERQTVTATVRIRPSRCPYGVSVARIAFGTSRFTSR